MSAFGLDQDERIALGLVPGYAQLTKFGRNVDVDSTSNTLEDITDVGGVYAGQPFGTSAELVTVVSSSTADTNSSGTGMKTIRLEGLDADWNLQSETIALAGQTPVDSVNTWQRVFRAYGVTAGTGFKNAGTITVAHKTTTSHVFMVIPAGAGQSLVTAYTIPAGYGGIVTRVKVGMSNAASSTAEAEVTLRSRDTGGCWRYREPLIVATGASALEEPAAGFVVTARTDLIVSCIDATADNLKISARYDLKLFPALS